MNPQQRELFRAALLRILDANSTRYGLGLPALGHLLGQFGYPNPHPDDVKRELLYLEDATYVAEVLKAVSPENRAWRITKEGRDFVAQLTNE